MKPVDSPTRLHARRQMISWLYRVKDEDGNNVNLANKLMDEIGPRFKEKNRFSGFTRIYKSAPEKGMQPKWLYWNWLKNKFLMGERRDSFSFISFGQRLLETDDRKCSFIIHAQQLILRT